MEREREIGVEDEGRRRTLDFFTDIHLPMILAMLLTCDEIHYYP